MSCLALSRLGLSAFGFSEQSLPQLVMTYKERNALCVTNLHYAAVFLLS